MSLKDALINDARIFRNAEEFGEPVVYVPRTGAERPIDAEVHREIPEDNEERQGALVPSLYARVDNSATTGISSAEVNTGGDKVRFAERIGGTVKDHPIIEVLSQDEGMMYLKLAPAR